MDSATAEFNKGLEVAQQRVVCMLEFSLQIHYAKAITNKSEKVSRLLCPGCKHNHLSQRDHSCIVPSHVGKLDHYFWDVLGILDEERVIESWYNSQTCTGFERAVLDIFMQKIRCRDYRETTMKSVSWQRSVSRIAQMMLRFGKLYQIGRPE
ncbi:uncharacterized protein LOC123527408 isoform X2 [Mercenaria mercenaria]|uniref:uncharacterized protein LOC123527408 isoform X2 n=1 Tax=Mercenaria mercenaria TaxID=6596 RepID=UPI00234F094F|nr:uncharacterized protein LOC123527408 isoform X2 [Mercenaria mercenaria]